MPQWSGPQIAMPALTMGMAQPDTEDCRKRFQAAVNVIQNLPKKGSYRPSYAVMQRFYGLYKQAVCGPCTASRPGFWDPVGRYKWDAWNGLGDMSSKAAMVAYVDEMKKVAQEVIDTMPMNEKTASFVHYFEPLYVVIHDMPRPPEALSSQRADISANEQTASPSEAELESGAQAKAPPEQELTEQIPSSEPQDGAPPEGLVLTSDSESEVFCDSVEQLDGVKLVSTPGSLHNGQAHTETSGYQGQHWAPVSQVTQVGAGQGGEGAGEGRGPVRRRDSGRDGKRPGWREPSGGPPHRGTRRAVRPASGGGGGDEPGGGADRQQDSRVQQQIVLALRRLREDMQSVTERLEVVEGLAAAHARNSEWRSHVQLTAPEAEGDWWPFDVSGRTLLLLLLWPFIAQGLVFLLRRKARVSI